MTEKEETVQGSEEVVGGEVRVAEPQNDLPTGVVGTIDGGVATTAGADKGDAEEVVASKTSAPLPSEVRGVELQYDVTTPEAERIIMEGGSTEASRRKFADSLKDGRVINQQVYAQVPASSASPSVHGVSDRKVVDEDGKELTDKQVAKAEAEGRV